MDENYTDNFSGAPSQGAGTAARMKEEVAHTAAGIGQKVQDLGRKTVAAIDRQRESTAGALDRTATAVHQTGDKVGNAVHATGDGIQATADYLREKDLKGMMNDVNTLVRRYPGQSLAVAAVVGFAFARMFRVRD